MSYIFSKKGVKKNIIEGFALAEMIIYIAIMSVISVVIVSVVLTVLKSNTQSYTYNNIKNSAISVLEKIDRETKQAYNINSAQDGLLVLDSKKTDGSDRQIRIYLDTGILKVDEDDVYIGPLTISGTIVSSITFQKIDTGNSQAVKIEMTIEGREDTFIKSETFYSTIILRGSY